MTTSLYLASAETRSGKSAIALGLLTHLVAAGGRVGVFRPVVRARGSDGLLELLLPRTDSPQDADASVGVTYEQLHADPAAAISTVVDRYHRYAAHHDVVLVIGSDYTDVPSPAEFAVNAEIAAHLGAGIVLIVPAHDRSTPDVLTAAELSVLEAEHQHARVQAVIANQVDPAYLEPTLEALTARFGPACAAVPAEPLLTAPTVGDLMGACAGALSAGDPALLDREAMSVIVAGMTMPNVLARLTEGAVVVCPSDREEVLLACLTAHRSSTFPSLSGVILNGGFAATAQVDRLVEGLDVKLPLIRTDLGTYQTAMACHDVRARITPAATRKIAAAIDLVQRHVDVTALVPPSASGQSSEVVTPLMFEHRITRDAARAGAHIVLPEGTEGRILRAARTVLDRGIARVTLLGNPEQVHAAAADLGIGLADAAVLDPATDPRVEEFAAEYARLRAHRGVTLDQARDVVIDATYFGTLMVHTGAADGMVSGSVTTTAHTVRPALEVIRTSPGVSVVSSVFFMCLADRVLVYGDCAINPDPDAAQLADIAISSAHTAAAFGVEPRVAMLSYSTGGSGSGADVEKVREATALVRERAPEIVVEGPIQYDAAVDPAVAATKLEGSQVAGRATVLVFPDLNTGNNTYKAVQRSADAVAVGPVLQGLNKPVNDLSRGATVRDIVNTIAMTALQAAARRESSPDTATAPAQGSR